MGCYVDLNRRKSATCDNTDALEDTMLTGIS